MLLQKYGKSYSDIIDITETFVVETVKMDSLPGEEATFMNIRNTKIRVIVASELTGTYGILFKGVWGEITGSG
jgi:hypothetical protein